MSASSIMNMMISSSNECLEKWRMRERERDERDREEEEGKKDESFIVYYAIFLPTYFFFKLKTNKF